MVSGSPPILAANTGVPNACASKLTRPNTSYHVDGTIRNLAFPIIFFSTSHCLKPVNDILLHPSAFCKSSCFSGPSPTTY